MYHVGKRSASDADTQAEQIREMINEGINAIFLCPVDWEKITPSLQALQDAGVKIINIDSQVKTQIILMHMWALIIQRQGSFVAMI